MTREVHEVRTASGTSRVVFFECLGRWQYLLVRWHLWRGDTVYYKRLSTGWQPKRRGLWLGIEKSIRQLVLVPPLYRWTNRSYDDALDHVEEVYRRHFSNKAIVKRLVRLFGSEAVHLAFKKALLEQLSEFFYYRLLIERVRQTVVGSGEVLFFLSNPRHAYQQWRFTRLLFPKGDHGKDGPAWRLSVWTVVAGTLLSFREKLGVLAVVRRCVRSLLRSKPRQRKVYDIAVAVVSPLRELHDGLRAAGFLADGTCIRKEQVLLVPVARLGEKEIEWLKGRGFNVSDTDLSLSWRVFYQLLRGAAHLTLSVLGDPAWLTRTAARAVLALTTWQPFTEHYRVGKFVTCADHTVDHIPRNILLKQGGASVWHYTDGQNTGEAMPPVDGKLAKSDLWGYLYYDGMVCWDQPCIKYFKMHNQQVGRYVAVGCLWSEHVRLIKEGVIPSTLPQVLREQGWRPGLKIVSVFPTWYHVDSLTSPEDGLAFVRGLEKLAAELPDVFVVLKEKHRRWLFANHSLWGGEEVLVIYQAYEELEKRPGWWLPGHTADTSAIVAASDLVISFPFTSVTVEAVGAGVKGLYFDPLGKYRGSAYDKIPALVAHGYDELKRRVEELLHETTPEDYRKYLETYFKGEKDPYLDARGLTRFRELLLGDGH